MKESCVNSFDDIVETDMREIIFVLGVAEKLVCSSALNLVVETKHG
jgi:hypothetical protein